MSRKIQLNEIEDGYILAESLSNKYNQVLIKKGTTLNKNSHIRILKMWGIDEILIYDDIFEENNKQNNLDEKTEVENLLLEKFGWIIKNKNDKLLFDIAVLSRLGANNFE